MARPYSFKVGDRRVSNSGYSYIITEIQDRNHIRIVFEDTGSEVITTNKNLLRGSIRDPHSLTACVKGKLGKIVYSVKNGGADKRLYRKWYWLLHKEYTRNYNILPILRSYSNFENLCKNGAIEGYEDYIKNPDKYKLTVLAADTGVLTTDINLQTLKFIDKETFIELLGEYRVKSGAYLPKPMEKNTCF